VAGKKYPLVLGQTPYSFLGWFCYPQVAANSGCFFMLVERPGWSEGLDNWTEDVLTARAFMAQNPAVDVKRVYLFGASAETPPLCQLLADQPDWWWGAILFNPTFPPDPAAVRIRRLLMLDGDEKGDVIKHWTDYQNQAARAGLAVDLAWLSGAGHIAISAGSEREKATQLAHFLSGD
jgi:hypothetical protein